MSLSVAVRVFFDAPEQADVVLPEVVVARAEQADAERAVLEQEAAKVRGDRLDADSDAVEVVAFGHVAQMLVEEQLLDADEIVSAPPPLRRIDIREAELVCDEAREVGNRQEAEFVVGRLEDGFSLVQHELGRDVLRKHELLLPAEHIELATVGRGSDTDRRRDAAALERRVRYGRERKEPVLAECGPVALEHVVAVIGIPPAFRIAERRNDAPAIRHGRKIGHCAPDGGLQSCFVARVLVRRRLTRPAAQLIGAELAVRPLVVTRIPGGSSLRRDRTGDDHREGEGFIYLRKHSGCRCR